MAVAEESDAEGEVSDLRVLIEGDPEYRAAVERAGLTPTRCAIISHLLIAAVSAHEAGKAGMDADSMDSANRIHPVNVGFVAEQEAEIRPLLEMWSRGPQRRGAVCDRDRPARTSLKYRRAGKLLCTGAPRSRAVLLGSPECG